MFTIGIAGGSGSGKTTFVHKLLKKIPREGVSILHQDSYYLPSPPKELYLHGVPNFDHPQAFDWPLLQEHLSLLQNGESVFSPVYDFKKSRRTSETHEVKPSPVIMIEGIFALWNDDLREKMDLRVFLNVDADIRFIRRLHRDVHDRGRTIDGVIKQYYDTVRPMYHEFLDTTRQFAHLIVGEETDVAADVVAAKVLREIENGHSSENESQGLKLELEKEISLETTMKMLKKES